MAAIREIKKRWNSICNIEQITRAMKLVSAVKLQKTKMRVENARAYFYRMYEEMQAVLSDSGETPRSWLFAGRAEKKAVIVVSADRGLAGGYSQRAAKLFLDNFPDRNNVEIYGIGKKGTEILAKKGYTVASEDTGMEGKMNFSGAAAVGRRVLDAFAAGEAGEIYLLYTEFKNAAVQIPRLVKLLPVQGGNQALAAGQSAGGLLLSAPKENPGFMSAEVMNYEPDREEVLNLLVPKYINSMIYGAVLEAAASENSARLNAMETASKNAQDMINALTLAYGRARQGAVTQELTEVVSGVQAAGL